MPLGLCNAPTTFQRCMLAIFHDMIEESVEVFMDDFSVFGSSSDHCLSNLDKMLLRCKDVHLVLNWEKCHFMVKEVIKDWKGTKNVTVDHLSGIENEETSDDSELHINITLADALILIPKYQKMLKSLLSNKEKLIELANTPISENCSAVILKKLPEKLGDPRKFLIPCGFSELKCKALADLGASINLTPLSVGKFTFPADFVIVDYESDKCMDKSKITRKQSKASKHGHENQKSSKRSQRYKAEAKSLAISSFMKPQGPILQIPKVIYNLKKGKEREGLKESKCQTPTVLTVEIRAPKVLLFTFLPRFTIQVFIKGLLNLSQSKATSTMVKAQIYVGFCAKTLTKEAQTSHQWNDTLAILRCPQLDQTATNEAQMIEEMIGQD
ncbi:reverse transcriptase domain-containing protein [Tanacetum coccineum]|uniref:Reverse transcriptase domain-containing protein n=1 Tax=Tanacetum coccineum TaxID=301880 RepID=A0ABQ5CSV8_9ASTR